MQRLEFEQLILEMVFEVGYERLTPASVAFFLRIPIKTAEACLDELARDNVLEIECDEAGRIYYTLPSPFEYTPRMLDQTLMRRSARGLGSHFAVAELAHLQKREDDGLPVSELIRDAQARERQAEARQSGDQAALHPLMLPDPNEPEPIEPDGDPLLSSDVDALVRAQQGLLEHRSITPADLAMLRAAPNPAVPMLLSFFWPGLGQIHNGQPGKGLLMFFTSAFLWLLFLGWVVTIYSVIDAGVIAGQRREDHIRRALTA